MAKVQRQFEQFHETIRVDYEMSKNLREKRDIVVNKIKKHMKDKGLPAVKELLQGSYIMKTGVKPINDMEYDIDIGLRFDIKPEDYTASEVRGWVLDAVDGHTNKVDDKGPCIRVYYMKGYHLDLVSYATWGESQPEQYRLAHKNRGWLEADPPRLLDEVKSYRKPFDELLDSRTSTDQFRRSVRYLRRWDDVAISKESNDKPSGLAYILLCRSYLNPSADIDCTSNDLVALKSLSQDVANLAGRIVERKPTPEYEDLFSKISESGMDDLKQRFLKLAGNLEQAEIESDPVEACNILRQEFGDDFPIPSREESAKPTKGPAIVTSSTSA